VGNHGPFLLEKEMKKILISSLVLGLAVLVLVLFQYPQVAEAVKTYVYGFRSQAGGASGTGPIDDIPQTLNDGDLAIGVIDLDDATYPRMFYVYTLDSNENATEAIPYRIVPDSRAGTENWVIGGIAETEFIPVGWMDETGTNPPATKSTFSTATNSREYQVRDFAGATQDEELTFVWFVPSGYYQGVKFRWIAIVTNATGPSSETVEFELSGVALEDTEDGGYASYGTAQASTSASLTQAQDDILFGPWSSAIAITGIAEATGTSTDQIVHFYLKRDQTNDTYGQDVGLMGIEVKYIKAMNIDY
jgi:hypothetical protein